MEFKDLVTDASIKSFNDGWNQGAIATRDSIRQQIKDQVCFDALADTEWRCSNHGGKCYELGLLFVKLGGQR